MSSAIITNNITTTGLSVSFVVFTASRIERKRGVCCGNCCLSIGQSHVLAYLLQVSACGAMQGGRRVSVSASRLFNTHSSAVSDSVPATVHHNFTPDSCVNELWS